MFNADGSGEWTRWDRGAKRFSTLWSTGPARHECYERATFDANTGEWLGTLKRFDTAKNLNEELPPPVPRDIKSVFRFKATSKKPTDSARSVNSAAAAAWQPSLRPGG